MRLTGLLLSLLVLSACASSEYPDQTDEGASLAGGVLFEEPLEQDAGNNPSHLVWDNFTANAQVDDLLVLNPRKTGDVLSEADGTLALFADASGSSLATATLQEPATAQWRQDAVAVDVNADGSQDLVVSDAANDAVQVLLNDGTGTFSDNATISVGNVPTDLLTWSDGGRTYLAVANRDGSSVSVLDNQSGTLAVQATLTTESTPTGLAIGDWNTDNRTDLAVLSRGTETVELWLDNGSGGFTQHTSTLATGGAPHSLLSGDWDCNGTVDLAVSNSSDDTLSLFYGDGALNFEAQTLSTGRGPSSFAAADFNEDGAMDFVVAQRFSVSTTSNSYLTGDLSLLLSQSQDTYDTAESFAASTAAAGTPPARLLIADQNGDAKLDLLVALPQQGKVAVLHGKRYSGSLSCP